MQLSGYKKEQALKVLQEKAREGDQDSQWKLYSEDPHESNLKWLCRAADQGNVNARSAPGNLYYYGSEKYGKFEEPHIQANLPQSCMWFHLSGKAAITDISDTEKARELPQHTESAEVERTARVMTEHELEEAETLLLAWEPGQCDHDFNQFLGESYSKDPALATLCSAADPGDFTSRNELGRIYFFGSGGAPEDLPRAYMWYRLAENVYVSHTGTLKNMQPICDAMTPGQHTSAKRLLERWEPGQCEKELTSSIKQQ